MPSERRSSAKALVDSMPNRSFFTCQEGIVDTGNEAGGPKRSRVPPHTSHIQRRSQQVRDCQQELAQTEFSLLLWLQHLEGVGLSNRTWLRKGRTLE